MVKIASNCPKLRELDISHSIEISHKALKMVEKSCKNVKVLMEPPSNVRLSQDETSNFGLSVRSITSRELLETIRQLNTNHDY
uniref:Putative F-box/LRR-repeat protein 19 n=1 Tax=Noccaea caerulescens TaxID=107243 RepID=A0A1J3I0H2_NOCCA